MEIYNPFTLLRGLSRKSPTVPAGVLDQGKLSDNEKELIRRVGITLSQLQQDIQEDVRVAWDRQRYTLQLNRALDHALISSALRLYATSATYMSPIHNASVWITSENSKYQKILSNLLDNIGVEEKIYDWAWSVAAFGDLFLELNGLPNLGIVSIRDDMNPVEISRIEHNGILVGFYKTPLGQTIGTDERAVIEPWKFVHLRLLGAKRARPQFGDPSFTEYKTMSLMLGHDTRQATTRYGTSLILDALPTYRRLRMAEDSLLLARMSRGPLHYLWKLRVNTENAEMLESLIDQIANVLKRSRAINTTVGSEKFESKENPFGVTEDLFLPLPDTKDLEKEEFGGSPDIRWIVDVEELKQQLACVLSTPLSLLGGYVDEATGALGSEAIEKLDIGFARNSRRLQRALITGIKRLCQIHLAWQNMDPDPALFEVNMGSPSTAEELSLQKNLSEGTETIDRFIEVVERVDSDVDKKEVFNYLNQKILKLEDFNLERFRKGSSFMGEKKENIGWVRYPIHNTDLLSFLPLGGTGIYNESKSTIINPTLGERSTLLFHKRWRKDWESTYGSAVVVEHSGDEKPSGQMTLDQEEKRKKRKTEEQQVAP